MWFKSAGERITAIWATALVFVVFLAMNPLMPGRASLRWNTGSSLARTTGSTTQCDSTPGAAAGSPTLGETFYGSTGTTVVSNVIFDASHTDDLVTINNGQVIFNHVTFRGTGTGPFGHTLEIKLGGSAVVRNSVFEGAPVEDTIQTEFQGTTLIECNSIGGTPGEEHIDMKPGGTVTIRKNAFVTTPTNHDILNSNDLSPIHVIGNTGANRIFFEGADPADAHGTIVDNQIDNEIWLYDTENVLVQGNTVPLVKHGEFGTSRVPTGTYFLNNNITTTFQFNGGTCYRDGNTGASLASCTSGPPPWY